MPDNNPLPPTQKMDPEGAARIDALMHQGLNQRIFPGAVLLAGVDGKVLFHKAYGMADLFSARPMTCETCFDLASLTKPLATAMACMLLVHEGRMALDHPVIETWPGFWGNDKKQITPRHLLGHSSGFPPWQPYYMRLQNLKSAERPLALKRWLCAEALQFTPGQKAQYSDLGFMILQILIEKISGRPLNQFVHEQIYLPLKINPLFFMTPGGERFAHGDFAATELCPWRNRLLCGQVHDDNAYTMGGVAGHAGLFGTAMAVFNTLQTLLRLDQGNTGQGIISPAVVHTFFQRQGSLRYALGFDMPSDQGSSAGRYFPADSVGHLGFSGTSFWAHRHKQVVVIMLTNRVHPSRFNPSIKPFRPALHDAIMEALGVIS